MKNPFSRRSFLKHSATVGTGLFAFGTPQNLHLSAASKKVGETDAPLLNCAAATQTSIDLQVFAGATGAPAGFSIQWMTAADFAANGNAWFSSEDPRLCKAGFSGAAFASRYNLSPGGCVVVRIGDILFDNGASSKCVSALLPGTEYVFRAFAHANNTFKRSENSAILKCRTLQIQNSPFQIPVNSADPLLLRATAADGGNIDWLGTRDENGFPLTVNLIEIGRTPDGETSNMLRYVLDANNRPVRMHSPNGTRFDLAWITPTQVSLSVTTQDGQTQVNTFVDLSPTQVTSFSGLGSSNTQFSPPALIPPLGTNTAPRGDQRIILIEPASMLATPPEQSNPLQAAAVTGSSVNVHVAGCGGLPADGDVYVSVGNMLTGFLGSFPAAYVSQGNYVAQIPSGLAPSLNPSDICQSIATVLGATCDWLISIPGAPQQLCAALGAAVASTGIGATVAAQIAAACFVVMEGLEVYCNTLGTGVPGGPSLADRLCESPVLDRTFTADVSLLPIVHALPTNIVGTPVQAPGDGPFPDLFVDLGIDSAIRSLTLNPPNPAAQQSYIATADIFCLPSGTVVTLSIVGTDGYTDSLSTTVSATQKSGTFTLWVPGAATAGIRDVVTVRVALPNGQNLTLTASLVFG